MPTVGELRQQTALSDSDRALIAVTRDEKLRELLGGRRLKIVSVYPDTTDADGAWTSPFKIELALESQMNTEPTRQTPSALYRPRIYIDGNKWCALYGENLQDGVCGFGESPADAMYAFDQAWNEKLKPRAAQR